MIAIIPFSIYFSEKLANITLAKGFKRNKNATLFVTVMILIPILIFSTVMFIEYKEKELDQIVSIDTSDYLFYTTTQEETLTVDKEDVKELNKLFSEHKVKRMKDNEWNNNNEEILKDKGYLMSVYTNNRMVMATIYENYIAVYSKGKYYKVVDGPIDLNWFKDVYEE